VTAAAVLFDVAVIVLVMALAALVGFVVGGGV
jgi:hypothetical protein